MYGHRLWAGRTAFTADEIAFMTEPYGDADKLRASWGVYESSTGNRPMSDIPRYLETNPIPALVLYGPEDHVVPTSFPAQCAGRVHRVHRSVRRARRRSLPPVGGRRPLQPRPGSLLLALTQT